jgi:hypothetical protein
MRKRTATAARRPTNTRSTAGAAALAAIVAAAAATQAFALPQSETPDIELYLSGSTAQDEVLENLLRLNAGIEGAPNICEPGTLDIYRGTIAGTGKRLYFCRTSDRIPGVAAGRRLAIHKSSGGSGEGVGPVAAREPVAFLDLRALPAVTSCQQGQDVRAVGDLAAYREHRGCDGGGRSVVPRAGLSDVEPRLFGGNTAGLHSRSQNQIVWGLPVTKNLRNALQAVQGLVASSVPHDDPQRDAEAVMPTLSRVQVAGIFAGKLQKWSLFYDDRGVELPRSSHLAQAPPANPDAAGATPGAYRPAAELGNEIFVCRRIASSGTQAAYETHYLRNRCVAGTTPFATPNDGSDVNTGGDARTLVRTAKPQGNVFAGVGTSDVVQCLDAHEEFNRWAVGMMSTETKGNNGNAEFRYVKVDGYAPTLLNAHHGRWSHISEQSINWLESFEPNLTSSDEGRVLSFIATNLGLPRALRGLNTGFVHPWGQGGYLAPLTSGFLPPAPPVTAEKLRDNPVTGVSKSLNGLNNCEEPILLNASGF